MDELKFRNWMIEQKNSNTIRTYIARCMRVESAFMIDLDSEYASDRGKALIEKLSYTRQDERNGIIPNCGIIFSEKANIYIGMHSLRTSVKKYFEFLEYLNNCKEVK